MATRIRAAGPEDAEALAALQAECFPGEPGWSVKAFRDLLGLPARGAWLALDAGEGTPVGFVIVQAAGEEAEILSLAVTRTRRGAGIGGELLTAAAAVLASRGCRRLHLEVAEDNAPALALYEKCGFRVVGRRAAYYTRLEGRVDAVLLARDLPCEDRDSGS